MDTRINILLIKKKYYLVSVNRIEGSNSKPRQGFDLLGKHQQFLYEKEIVRGKAYMIIKDLQRELRDKDFGVSAIARLFGSNGARDYRTYPPKEYTGGDLTSLLYKALNQPWEVSIYTKAKGYIFLRMTKNFAETNKVAIYKNAIKGMAISNSLDKTKKSVRFMYEISLAPEITAVLAKKVWFLNPALARRMLEFSGNFSSTDLKIVLHQVTQLVIDGGQSIKTAKE